ncbi:glycosyltransferase [Altererythrobacter salegens]|uniref:Glycosyltransferase n=1 Tax=Croceibacterium salegens TaxID=1737568 RepID=A0A6I4SQA0_9SPHN|nr:glycosyltransferase family 1 protein [Croceibacterium salegens]MXO57985.1 glycosyltransferase [Croceibacterium salegens]
MTISGLRIALFSGNYNMTVDGANRALNRLVEYLQRQGATVRVYSPTSDKPAFEPQGTLVSLPSIAIPTRAEYHFPLGLNRRVRADLDAFDPHIVHLSSPDLSARAAAKWAIARGTPILASVHTRFETYFRYYKLGFLEKPSEDWIRTLYGRCDALVTPSAGMVDVLREQEMNDDISLWERGVDREVFSPERRSLEWRRSLGIGDGEVAIGFLGRLVMEKGLDTFADAIDVLEKRRVAHRVLVVGDGPARGWFGERLPNSVFAGFQGGADLGRAAASMDVLFNPSVTETFGNVTLEAMACGVPVVAAQATGSSSLVKDGVNGVLVPPRDIAGYADALQRYVTEPDLRAAHGAAGEVRSRAYSWDAINQAVADTYLRLIAARKGCSA